MKRILLAEDDRDDQLFFELYLKDRKDIAVAKMVINGEEVLEYLNTVADHTLPDLIILDHNMPRMNGLQTLQIIKQDAKLLHIPVMIYSTYTDKQLIDAALKNGAHIVYNKPQSEDGYNALIDDFLKCTKGL